MTRRRLSRAAVSSSSSSSIRRRAVSASPVRASRSATRRRLTASSSATRAIRAALSAPSIAQAVAVQLAFAAGHRAATPLDRPGGRTAGTAVELVVGDPGATSARRQLEQRPPCACAGVGQPGVRHVHAAVRSLPRSPLNSHSVPSHSPRRQAGSTCAARNSNQPMSTPEVCSQAAGTIRRNAGTLTGSAPRPPPPPPPGACPRPPRAGTPPSRRQKHAPRAAESRRYRPLSTRWHGCGATGAT